MKDCLSLGEERIPRAFWQMLKVFSALGSEKTNLNLYNSWPYKPLLNLQQFQLPYASVNSEVFAGIFKN